MRLQTQLRAAPGGQPGHGELVISGWEHARDGLELNIQRNSDSHYLTADRQWGGAPVWHVLGEPREDDGALVVAVGPWLVDPLLADSRMAYQLTLRNADGEGTSRLLLQRSGLLSSAAAGSSQSNEKTTVHANPVPPPVAEEPPAAPEPEVTSEPEPPVPVPPAPPPAKPSRWWLWLLLAVLALALIGAALWWFGLRQGGTPGGSTDAGDASPCGAASMKKTTDDLLFIRTCLASAPSSSEVLNVIAAAKAANRCNLVQRLYAHKAQAGDVEVALAYAREYDPQSFSGGCIGAADAETAVYWYEIVTEHAPDNPEAQQRLKELNP